MRRHDPAGRTLSGRRPHLMDEWRDAFATEPRLRDVPGTQVGEALAEVDAQLLTLALAPPLIAGITGLAFQPGAGRRGPVLVAIGAVVTMAAAGVIADGLAPVVVTLPGPVLLATGAVLLAAAWWRLASGRAFADRVVDPRSGQEPFPLPRWLLLLLRFGPPAILVLAAAVIALVPHTQP